MHSHESHHEEGQLDKTAGSVFLAETAAPTPSLSPPSFLPPPLLFHQDASKRVDARQPRPLSVSCLSALILTIVPASPPLSELAAPGT